ncbi:MAG: hypothetical protein ABFS19_03490 [Thermodesulfobacteriota bacterium]
MVYVKRDENGSIITIHNENSSQDMEKKDLLDPEIMDFFFKSGDQDSYNKLLGLLDQGIIRVLDDLVELLIKKNIILATELPLEAQRKINERVKVRKKLMEQHLMVDDII